MTDTDLAGLWLMLFAVPAAEFGFVPSVTEIYSGGSLPGLQTGASVRGRRILAGPSDFEAAVSKLDACKRQVQMGGNAKCIPR